LSARLRESGDDSGLVISNSTIACLRGYLGIVALRPSLHLNEWAFAWIVIGSAMSKPVIFTISAVWDDDASVWSGHCDDIPAAADAPTLDALLAKISATALDLLPDNHPDVDPSALFLQITALREVERATA
jgi:hypothetical protein